MQTIFKTKLDVCDHQTVEQLAKKIIDYNFRFLEDFDFKEWD